MLDLNGASALVTGGASGLGRGCAAKLAAHGAKILIADLDEAEAIRRGVEYASEAVCRPGAQSSFPLS